MCFASKISRSFGTDSHSSLEHFHVTSLPSCRNVGLWLMRTYKAYKAPLDSWKPWYWKWWLTCDEMFSTSRFVWVFAVAILSWRVCWIWRNLSRATRTDCPPSSLLLLFMWNACKSKLLSFYRDITQNVTQNKSDGGNRWSPEIWTAVADSQHRFRSGRK